MDDSSKRYAMLTGSTTLRWQKVLSPVIFMDKQKQDLIPIFRMHQVTGLQTMMKEPKIAEAMAKAMPGNKFSEFLPNHIEETAAQGLSNLYETVYDSALVFGHAILDDVLNQCLALAGELKPDFFLEKIALKKIDIRELRGIGLQSAIQNQLQKYFKSTERDSIVDKFDTLWSVCKPTEPLKIIEQFVFNREKVIDIDELRHSIVHSTKLRTVSYADLDYFRLASMFAIGMLKHAGIKMSVQDLIYSLGINWKLPTPIEDL